MADKILSQVLLSSLEYRVSFQEPLFDALHHSGLIVSALFQAFREWNVGLENISEKTHTSTVSEAQITVQLPKRKITFTVGLANANFLVTDPNWGEANALAKIARAGVTAVQASTGAILGKQAVTLSMHLKPQGRSIGEITSDFLRLDGGFTHGKTIRSYGFSIYTEDCSWVVDLSTIHKDALHVKLTRDFEPGVELDEIVSTLVRDEFEFLELLGLRLELDS